MDDLISRQEAKVAMRKLKKWYVVGEEHKQKNIGVKYDDVMFTLDKLPSAQPEHLVKESGNLVKGLVNDCISRQAAIDALCDNCDDVKAVCAHYPCKRYIAIEQLPSAQSDIIRCKDCEWFRKEYGWNCIEYTVCGVSPTHHPIRREEDFCSFAERRQDGTRD